MGVLFNLRARFWQGRFKCQRLEDEGAILACMAYVDLNPVRAGVADSPESREFTSVYDRIVARKAQTLETVVLPDGPSKKMTVAQDKELSKAQSESEQDAWLSPIDGLFCGSSTKPIGIDLEGYLELVDFTGRSVKEVKAGHIPEKLLPILKRLELDESHWVETVRGYGSLYYRVAGKLENLSKAALVAGQKWFQGSPGCRLVYASQRE